MRQAGSVDLCSHSGEDFLSHGGLAQRRYEALRVYMLLPRSARPPMSPARFDIGRVERFGLLGLLERDPAGEAWHTSHIEDFQIEVIPVGTADATARAVRLYAFLHQLLNREGDQNAASCPLRPRLERAAGTGAHHSESAGRAQAIC